MTLTSGLLRTTLAVGLLLAAWVAPAWSASPQIYMASSAAPAVGGYDPVAYFRTAKPVAGRADITWSWRGATWRFASAENRAAFQATPEAFAPQYGGYCAWAVAQGYTAKGDPRHWQIVNGKLYLNYDGRVQATWEKDIAGHVRRGDKNWPAVLKK